MAELGQGPVRKMVSSPEGTVQYRLPLGDAQIPMNALIGSTVQLVYSGKIRCLACGRATRKSFQQGHCFPCFRRLASCDSCIVRPEECHYDQGTCREPEWGRTHCLIPHTVYLSNTGTLKVGITRGGNEPTRWVDQGATQALAIRTVPTRLDSGRVEVALKAHVADRTNWRKMLSGAPEPLDMVAERDRLMALLEGAAVLPGEQVQAEAQSLDYPVLRYPEKVRSLNLDKSPIVEGTLEGIKGQYLILDTGVINMRKYGGYVLSLSSS